MKLYEITEEYRAALDDLIDQDLPQQVIDDTLNAMQGELYTKAKAVAAAVLNMEAEAKAADEHAKRLATRAKRLQNKAGSLRSYLLQQLQAADIDKLPDPILPLAVRKNPPALKLLDEDAVPTEWRADPKPPPPDKARIKKALQDGILECNWARIEKSARVQIG